MESVGNLLPSQYPETAGLPFILKISDDDALGLLSGSEAAGSIVTPNPGRETIGLRKGIFELRLPGISRSDNLPNTAQSSLTAVVISSLRQYQ